MLDYEVAHAGLTELHVVETMHERKAMMAERAVLLSRYLAV
jgi:predicted Rossmann-fold nucleotide-binding protein